MDKPIVSVIVPVYNVSAFLPGCLESLLGQTLREIEVLCVDDASADDSANVVLSFQETDDRVRLLRQTHAGVSAARNLGLANAKGKYVTFVDADDWVESTMLDTMVSRAEADGCDMVVCSAQVHFQDGSQRSSLERALTADNGLWQREREADIWNCLGRNGSWPFVWNKLYRKELLREHGIGFSSRLSLGEDGAFLVLLWQYAQRIAFIGEKLYHYRYQRKESATVRLYQNEVRRFLQHIDVVEVLLEEFSERGMKEGKREHLLRWILDFLYYDFVRLPSSERREISEKLKAVLDRQGMVPAGLKPYEMRRLQNLLETGKECTPAKRSWDIWRLRIENRIQK